MVASADQVSMVANDPGGTSSLISAGQWSDGQPPNATNDYFSSVFFIRTPGDGNNYTFAGHSLTLQPPTTAQGSSTPIRSIIFKGSGGNIYTINNLTNAGGVINSGSGNVTPPTFTGNLMTVVSNSTIQGDQGTFNIGYPLAGSADLTNSADANAHGVSYTATSTNSAFTGRLIISQNATMTFNSIYNVPGNPTTPTPGQITIYTNCTFWDNAGITYSNSNGGITLAGTGATITTTATNASGVNLPTTISVPITDNGAGYSLTKRGGSILTLSGNNTFSGGLNMLVATAGSQLNINNANALGTGPFILASGGIAPALLDNTSGLVITLVNNNFQTWSNNFVFLGSSSLDMGSGAVALGGNITAAISNNNFSVGPISDGGSGYSLNKSGLGALTVNGGISITGGLTINEGILTLAGSGSLISGQISIAGAGTLDVTGVGGLTLASGQTLQGDGTISGALTAGDGATIVPGANNVAGTLTVNGDFALAGGGALNFELADTTTPGGGTNGLIVVTGNLDISGATIVGVSGTPVHGTYTLFQYGTFSGDVANLSAPAGFSVVNDTAAKAIEIVISHIPTSLTWKGDGSANVWDTGVTANWLQSGTPQFFFTGDSVTFNDTGSASPPINLSGFISPAQTTVNAAQNYDFTGSGILSGSLDKSGSGTLILENDNSYSGATTITGGVLQAGNGGASGSFGSGAVSNNATLVFNRSDAVTISNSISGSGDIAFSGASDLFLTGSNSYTGTTTVSSTGTLHPRNPDALGIGGTLINTSGGRIYFDLNLDFPNTPLTLGGPTALQKGGAGVSTLGGAVNLVSDTTLNVDGGATLNLTNASGINGAGANANLTLAGGGAGNVSGPISLGAGNLTVAGGTWTVAPTNSYSGLTTINGGALLLTGPLSLGQPPDTFNPSQVTLNGGALGTATNVTLADGKIGIFLAANSGIVVNSTNATLTISNNISGDPSLTLTKTGPGKLVLTGANDFGGSLNIDSGSGSANDGTTVIANNAAIANIPPIPGIPFISIRNNNSGSSTLALDGSSGSITIPQDISVASRNVAVPTFENIAGTNTISGAIGLHEGGSMVIFQSDSGLLITSGQNAYIGALAGARSYVFTGSGDNLVTGPIINSVNGAPISLTKSGTGTLTLAADNTYGNLTTINDGLLILTGSISSTGTVVVAGGTLSGTGVINDSVSVTSGGTLSPGISIGTLTINGGLNLAGTTVIEVDQGSGASDQVTGLASVNYGGALVVSNLSGTLSVGDHFHVFTASATSGNFTSVAGSAGIGLFWSFDPVTGDVTVVNGPATNPTDIQFSVSGSTLSLSWPSDHLGWILQSQTNSLGAGLSTNWTDVTGSASVTSTNLTISPANPAVFYRLRLPR
jgi:fibronectin-binding autotransporter adhesin